MGFLWDFYGILWDFYGISMGILKDFYGISMGFLWDFYWLSMGFLWGFYGISVGFLLAFYGISMGFLWGFYWLSMGFLWGFYGISMRSYAISMRFYGMSMGFLWDFYGISMRFLCDSMGFYGISVGFLWAFYGILIAHLQHKASLSASRFSLLLDTSDLHGLRWHERSAEPRSKCWLSLKVAYQHRWKNMENVMEKYGKMLAAWLVTCSNIKLLCLRALREDQPSNVFPSCSFTARDALDMSGVPAQGRVHDGLQRCLDFASHLHQPNWSNLECLMDIIHNWFNWFIRIMIIMHHHAINNLP